MEKLTYSFFNVNQITWSVCDKLLQLMSSKKWLTAPQRLLQVLWSFALDPVTNSEPCKVVAAWCQETGLKPFFVPAWSDFLSFKQLIRTLSLASVQRQVIFLFVVEGWELGMLEIDVSCKETSKEAVIWVSKGPKSAAGREAIGGGTDKSGITVADTVTAAHGLGPSVF
jgi:hypothetical protein